MSSDGMFNFSTLLRHRTFLACLLAGAFSYGGMFAFISGSAFVFIEILGLAPHQYGYRFAASPDRASPCSSRATIDPLLIMESEAKPTSNCPALSSAYICHASALRRSA